jgi:adenine-specific DNA-methyltransferase
MDKRELQKKLNKPYTTENWKEVVQFVFPNVSLLNPPSIIPIDNEKVESFRQIGNVRLEDGKNLALFELKLKPNVNIIRNRVELNNLVSKYIDQEQNHGVLSIFEQGGDDYRFTFSARASEFDEEGGDFVTTKTDTKRFTYVLGKNESCKTPAQRFFDLSENKNKTDIKAIEDAFSVEKLSKTFFKEYKEQYTSLVNFMMQTPGIFKAIYSEDDKAIRDFVKILLGRIIFIKFVQKKGWMGVAVDSKKWIDGDYRFLENGFAHFKYQDLFYSNFLEPLFDTLDQPNRPNDIFTVTQTRVPYLSGGLFELEDKKTKNINFPAKYFNDLFEFLDKYNFTIDENDINDHEVGIDPEMLGHIFENLLEDNKDKGAFYTPKEIVRYMCQESLKEYLKTSLENNKQWPTNETEVKEFEQALHNFVTKKEAGGIIEFEETIARALKDVKICDPAIGSGAFPMGLLNEIFQLVHKLHDANKDKLERVWGLTGWQPNLVKQNIIQNSIYGVDIEKGAVDVARLRFWLSLIVDEPEPKALPHLDYKIVVGNSLVSKLDETIIDIDWEVQNDNNLPETDLFGKPKPKQFNVFEVENNEKQKQLLKDISTKQKAVFDPNSNEEKLSLEIRNLKIDLLINQLDAMVKTKGLAVEPKGPSKTIKAQTELWLQTIGWQQQISKLQKLKKNPYAPLHFFDWKLDFPEIMNEQVAEKIGFDIVIANPPYLGEKGNKDIFQEIRSSNWGNKFYQRRMDLFYYFFHLALDLTGNKSSINFITTNYYPTASFANKLRNDIKDRTKIKVLIDFHEYRIFNSAKGQHNLITILTKDRSKSVETLVVNVDRSGDLNNDVLKSILNLTDSKTKHKFVNEEDLFFGDENYLKLKLNSESEIGNNIEIILEKIIKKRDYWYGDLVDLNQGIVSGTDKVTDKLIESYPALSLIKDEGVFIINKQEKDLLISKNIEAEQFIKPIYKNSDLKKWSIIKKSNLFIIYLKEEGKSIQLPNSIKEHFEKFEKILIDKKENCFKNEWLKKIVEPWLIRGNYFVLFYPREKKYFEQLKIVNSRRAKSNIFALENNNYYEQSDIVLANLKPKSPVSLHYLISLLNSKLYYIWLYNKGKRKGEQLELFQKPLKEIPIAISSKIIQTKLEYIVNEIQEKKMMSKNTTVLEQQIDDIVYKLYELTYDEVLVVEPEFSERMSMEEYEGLMVE